MRATDEVRITGVVPPGPGGMRDYGDILSSELTARGVSARPVWFESEGRRIVPFLRVNWQLLAAAASVKHPTAVVWNYAPVPLGVRGVPGPGVLHGAVLRARGVPAVTVVHELAQPLTTAHGWSAVRRGIRTLAQSLAILIVLAGSGHVVVTTDERVARLRLAGRLTRTRIHCAPVFSNFGTSSPRDGRSDGHRGTPQVVILDHGADEARPDLVLDAMASLGSEVTAVLLGSPAPGSSSSRRWLEAATRVGVPLSTTGVVERPEFVRRLVGATVVVLPNAQGPSGRKGTLAAALAHGSAVVALDGPRTWPALRETGAVRVVEPEAGALRTALHELLHSGEERARLSVAARAFYDTHMAVGRTVDVINEILGLGAPSPASGRDAGTPW